MRKSVLSPPKYRTNYNNISNKNKRILFPREKRYPMSNDKGEATARW